MLLVLQAILVLRAALRRSVCSHKSKPAVEGKGAQVALQRLRRNYFGPQKLSLVGMADLASRMLSIFRHVRVAHIQPDKLESAADGRKYHLIVSDITVTLNRTS